MWNFKSCPRCRGDIFIDEDTDKCYEKCLQCGYERELTMLNGANKNKDSQQEKTGVC